MCGICFICSLVPLSEDKKCPLLDMEYIQGNSSIPRRGPDISKSLTRALWSKFQAIFAAFVLHLRGCMTPQPVTNDDGDMLLWNGEIFGGIEVNEDENDTRVLFNHLVKCTSEQEILATIQAIQGPWAFIFWQSKQERLWFGRDVFGRRSLLWHLPHGEDDVFALSSVPVMPLTYKEVPSVGVFYLETFQGKNRDTCALPHNTCQENMEDNPDCASSFLTLHLFPWEGARWPGTDQEVSKDCTQSVTQKLDLEWNKYLTVAMHSDLTVPSWMPHLNLQVPSEASLLLDITDCALENDGQLKALQEIRRKGQLSTLVSQLQDLLLKAVIKRVLNLPNRNSSSCDNNDCALNPKPCNSSHISKLCDSFTSMKSGIDHQEYRTPKLAQQSRSCSAQSDEPEFLQPENTPLPNATVSSLMFDEETGREASLSSDSHACIDVVRLGAEGQSGSGGDGTNSHHICPQVSRAHVAILFSGGVDSTVLAALADRCLPAEESIDLINVAFEQVSVPDSNRKKKGQQLPTPEALSSYNVPDRQTGYSALSELNPQRHWNFVEVNVTQKELQEQRSAHVRHLVYPLNTVLDDSIGCAVWFAARGKGILGNGPHRSTPYTSTARVLLCGMGADEQLAGYSRHRCRFQQESWEGLVAEINMEIHRISARNLGRDDRVITDHGKESRFPFLDEEVVSFLSALPIYRKVDIRLPRGAGEKLLLRLLALQLGLHSTSALPKRAIQFGSRIAKLEQSKEKGSQVCQRLL